MLSRAIFIIFTFCILGCKQVNDTQAKFIAHAQRHARTIKLILINKVHKPEWKIRYGFADNNGCGKAFGEMERIELTTAITEALQTWLQALEHRGNIVQNFSYELHNTSNAIYSAGFFKGQRTFYSWLKRGKFDLDVIFYCRANDYSFASYKKNRIELHISEHIHPPAYYSMTNKSRYHITTLIHEVGHAFGLSDTYVDNRRDMGRYNTSDGGAKETVGMQPLSVMSLNYLIAIDPNSSELMLGADDHAGINWLYDFHQYKGINKDSCPQDYVYEPNTKGCAPLYPLIFAVKQAHFLSVEKLLHDDPNIDLNQQDSFGNTALHYAANLAGLHGRKLYDFLLSRGVKDTLSNKNNETAPEVLAGKHSKFIATMFAAVRHVPEQRSKTARQRRIAMAQRNIMLKLVQEFVADKSNNVNMQDKTGNTLLHYAAIYGHSSLFNTLLKRSQDIDVNAQARVTQETILHKVARYGHSMLAVQLREHYEAKIDTSVKDMWGKTALDRALYEEQQARNKGKTRLANDFKTVAEIIREIDLKPANKKRQNL